MNVGPRPALAPLVWIAGTGWDNVAGTDRRLVEELSRLRTVLWVDPPVAVTPATVFAGPKRRTSGTFVGPGTEWVTNSVLRLRVLAPPGVTRFGMRSLTALCLNRAICAALAKSGWAPEAVVVAFPLARFPRRVAGRRIFYVTDDWLSGAGLMGFSRAAIKRAMASNVAQSHMVAAVSAPILEDLRGRKAAGRSRRPGGGQEFVVLPNGSPRPAVGTRHVRDKIAGLVGQLNERLDLDVLEAVQSAGVRIRVIGPRTDTDPVFGQRLNAFLRRENVEWKGPLPTEQIAAELSRLGAGLTPYTDSAFNRASFPLKTLEYLSSGVGVVATDSPAVRWLNTEHIAVAEDATQFVHHVLVTLSRCNDATAEMERRAFAGQHTWQARSLDFIRLIEGRPVAEPENKRRIKSEP